MVDDPDRRAGRRHLCLQVATSNPNNATVNASTNAENMWSIEVTGGTNPQVYGNGKMAVYNNLQAGAAYQLFYLAKIDQPTGAGKTALIDLFDPGDVSGNATLKVLSPDGNTQTLATFSYTTDSNCVAGNSDACSGTNVSQIKTASRRQLELQQHVDPHQHPAAQHLRPGWAVAGWLVADPVRDAGRRQRHHDLAGLGAGQPGPPGGAMIDSGRRLPGSPVPVAPRQGCLGAPTTHCHLHGGIV